MIIYNLKNPYLGLGNGRRYWGGGGGIGRGGIGGTTIYIIYKYISL